MPTMVSTVARGLHVPTCRRLSTTLVRVYDPKHNLSTPSSKAPPTTVAGNVITHAYLVIRKECVALSTKEVIVPHSKHSHDGWYLQIIIPISNVLTQVFIGIHFPPKVYCGSVHPKENYNDSDLYLSLKF